MIQYTPRDYKTLLCQPAPGWSNASIVELVELACANWLDPQHPACQVAGDALQELGISSVREVELVPGVTTRMRWIPPGRFLMGSPKDEVRRHADEQQHWVTLTRGFWLGETAVTQREWEAVMGENPSRFKGEQHPVDSVSWNDCAEFLKRAPLELRLPTEAEWEYACRAGTQTPFSFGENITTDQVNYDGNSPYPGGAKGEYRRKTVPVRSLPPNEWGLYEMHGNTWEWCSDRYDNYPTKEQRDPVGPETGIYRVLRGGSWLNCAWYCRSAQRLGTLPNYRWNDLGFRLLAEGHVLVCPEAEPAYAPAEVQSTS